jgi:hypothetical protein
VIRHIVMWKLREDACGGRAAGVARARGLLDACRAIVPGIESFEVDVAGPASDFDVVLVSAFRDQAALDAYQQHPAHLAIKPFFQAATAARHCVDYVC